MTGPFENQHRLSWLGFMHRSGFLPIKSIVTRWLSILLLMLWPLLVLFGNLPHDRGLPWIMRQPSGRSGTNVYDALKRLTNHSDSLGAIAFQLDANGTFTSVVEGARSNSWTLDAYDQPLTYKDA